MLRLCILFQRFIKKTSHGIILKVLVHAYYDINIADGNFTKDNFAVTLIVLYGLNLLLLISKQVKTLIQMDINEMMRMEFIQ